jgi:glycosyltransferase involved in cell wall biosynthesis
LQLGIFGRINEWKGHLLLLKAMARAVGGGRDIRLVVVGDPLPGKGELAASLLASAAELGLSGRISFLGYREDTPELMESCDVVVVPSELPEPFGLVAIEAMTCRKPVIAAAHGGLLDIVQDQKTGWLFRPGSVEDLARVITLAADSDGLQDMGQAGAGRVQDHFSSESFRSKIEEVYARACDDSAGLRPLRIRGRGRSRLGKPFGN